MARERVRRTKTSAAKSKTVATEQGDVVAEIEDVQTELRAAGRAALGVTGERVKESIRQELERVGVGIYPLLALGILTVVDGFQLQAFLIMAPEIRRSLGISRGLVPLLVLTQALAVTFAALPIAAAVERRPLRALIAKVSGVSWGLATLLTGFVTNGLSMAGILALDGASTGSVTAIHQPLLVDTYPTSVRARILSGYRVFREIGAIIAPLLLALLLGPFDLTWRGAFLVMGGVSVLAAMFSFGLKDPGFGHMDTAKLREAVRERLGRSGEREDDAEYQLRFFEIVRRLMMIPTIRRVLFSHVAIGILFIPFFTYFTFFLEIRWGLTPEARALFFAVIPVAAIAVLVLLSRVDESLFRQDPARLFRLGAGLQIAGLMLLALGILSPWFWLMIAASALAVALFSALAPALTIAYLSIVRPQMRPHAAALAGIFQIGVGGTAGTLLLGGIDQQYGILAAILISLVPGIFSALILRNASRTVNVDLDRSVAELVEEEEVSGLLARGDHLPMLACRKIDFSYGNLQVLFGVDFTVDDGEMVALLGTNGAGKSTLLRVISGLGLPTRGTVRFRGHDISYVAPDRRLGLGISTIPGGRAVFPRLTVIENLRLYGYSLGRNRGRISQGIEECLHVFPRLGERQSQQAMTLSGGEQQMLALAKAFLLKPQLLLIDELSLGLAPKIVSELIEMVRRINAEGSAVVLVEQSANVALSLVEHAYFMEKGEIRFDGRAEELLERDDLLRSVFLEGAASVLTSSTPTKGRRG